MGVVSTSVTSLVSLGRILIPEADFHPGDLGPQSEEGSLYKAEGTGSHLKGKDLQLPIS